MKLTKKTKKNCNKKTDKQKGGNGKNKPTKTHLEEIKQIINKLKKTKKYRSNIGTTNIALAITSPNLLKNETSNKKKLKIKNVIEKYFKNEIDEQDLKEIYKLLIKEEPVINPPPPLNLQQTQSKLQSQLGNNSNRQPSIVESQTHPSMSQGSLKLINCDTIQTELNEEILKRFEENREVKENLVQEFKNIFIKSCNNIEEAKQMKNDLQNKNRTLDINKLYTLFYIYIIDYLQYNNISILSLDENIINSYKKRSSNNSNVNLTNLTSSNANYLELAKEILKEYNKLEDRTFFNYKKQLVESHNNNQQ